MAGATLYSGFASLELARSVQVVFHNNLALEQLQDTLDRTDASFSEYLRSKSSDSLKDYIKWSQRLNDQASDLNRDVVADSALLLQRDLARAFETYLRTAEAGIQAKRGRDVPSYAERFEAAERHAGAARTLIADLRARFLARALQAFSRYQSLIPGVLVSNAALVLAAALLGFTLLLRYSRRLTEPLSRLAEAAEAVGRGDYREPFPPVDSQDEIGTLARTFAQMQLSVRQSFDDLRERAVVEKTLLQERMRVLELDHRLKDAELLALQTQINPHFLFNTLSAGIELAGSEAAGRTESFLENLAVFIRYALTPPNRSVVVADELDCVNRYIGLLRTRFRDRFQFEVSCEPGLLSLELPALILQPLLENAVSHGLGDRESGGRVSVRGVWEGGRAVLSVSDNGVGMPAADREAVLSETAEPDKTSVHGIGLRNVIRRIRLATGGRGDVELRAEPGQGLEVRILLPGPDGGGR